MAGGTSEQQAAMRLDKDMSEQQVTAGSSTKTTGSAGVGRAGSIETSTTKSGISGIAGDESVRTGDDSSAGTLVKDWNTGALVKDVQAQAVITQQFSQNAAQAIGNYADQKYSELKNSDPAEAAKWAEGGEYRVALHTVAGGLAGGLQGALGAGASQAVIDGIGQQIANADLPLVVKQILVELAGAAVGAAVGGSAGAASGFAATVNNYLTVADLTGKTKELPPGSNKEKQQEQSLANNAKVEEACIAKNAEACGKAIAQTASDINDLRDYRGQLIAERQCERSADEGRPGLSGHDRRQADRLGEQRDSCGRDGAERGQLRSGPHDGSRAHRDGLRVRSAGGCGGEGCGEDQYFYKYHRR